MKKYYYHKYKLYTSTSPYCGWSSTSPIRHSGAISSVFGSYNTNVSRRDDNYNCDYSLSGSTVYLNRENVAKYWGRSLYRSHGSSSVKKIQILDIFGTLKADPYIKHSYTKQVYKNDFILNGYTGYDIDADTGRVSRVYGRVSIDSSNVDNYIGTTVYHVSVGDYEFDSVEILRKVGNFYENKYADWDIWIDDLRTVIYDEQILSGGRYYKTHYSKGDFIETIVATEGDYPNDGRQDGYWWVKGGIAPNFSPRIKIGSNIVKTHRAFVKVNGTIKEIDRAFVKVNGTIKEID